MPPSPLFQEGPLSEGELQAWRQEILSWIRTQSEGLETILLKYNAFDMIANLTFAQLFHDPETYSEPTHHGLAAVIEYATLMYLKHPFNQGNDFVIDGSALKQVEDKIRGIITAIGIYWAAEGYRTTPDKDLSALDDFRFRTISHELIVRGPGYLHHQREQLRALFQPIDNWILSQLGFSVNDALILDGAIEEIINRNLETTVQEGRQSEAEILEALRGRRKGDISNESDETFIQHIQKLSAKEAQRRVRDLMTLWLTSSLGTRVFSFSPDEVALQTGLPKERIQAVLEYFGLDFGSIPADFFIPSPINQLRTNPFLHHESRHLYPVPGTLAWAMQQRLEASIKSNSLTSGEGIWKTYERQRADYLERESMRLLGVALRNADVHRGLTYQVTEDGELKTYELDGLVVYDLTLFLVEAKAGAFSPSARRGSKDRLKRDLKELLGEAHTQVIRAKRYIETTDSPRFVTRERKDIYIDKSQMRRTFLVTITLESLDTFNAVLHEVARTGVLEDAELPWAVSLDVLRVICEMNEFPSQLVHYLQRRLRLNEFGKFQASDELDWFGYYLSKGLYFEMDTGIAKADFVAFSSYTKPFDDYYYYEMGLRKTPTPKPVQPMPQLYRDIIFELEGRGNSKGHSEAVLQLLEWDEETRREFVRLFEYVRNLTRRDSSVHDFTMASSKAGAGLTCYSTIAQETTKTFEQLASYVRVRKYREHADDWLGLLTVVDRPGLVHGFICGHETWEHDEGFEVLAGTLQNLPAPKKKKKAG